MAKTPMDWSTGVPFGNNPPITRHGPQDCRWGDSTLYTAYPEWLSAWDAPWTCRHAAHAGPLETAETCATCPDWRPRDSS